MVIMIVVFIITLLATAPIGGAIWSGIPPLNDWIIAIPNTAGGRGALMCAALAAVILGIRTLLQKEAGLREIEEGA
jgi:hypothetical protein